MQPAAFSRGEIALDFRNCARRTKMHVRRFPAHVVEKLRFVFLNHQRSEFDARAIGSEAANDPVSAKCHSRILHADRGVDQLQTVHNIGRAVLVPDPSGRANTFRFARDQCALPGREREYTRMTKAAEPSDTAPQLVRAATAAILRRACALRREASSCRWGISGACPRTGLDRAAGSWREGGGVGGARRG